MSTIKSSAENLTLNADGSGNEIILQSNGSNVATIDQAGLVTATTFAGSGASLTALNATNLGSGTVPTARLGSGTASSSTVLYGDQTYKAEPTGGKVLQVVSSTSTTGTYAGTSYDVVSSATIAITPSATSSKIFYIYNCGGLVSDNCQSLGFKFYRDAVLIRHNNRWGYNENSEWTSMPISFMFLDSPSTTSEVTYTIQAQEQASASWEINDTATTAGAIVMAYEIGA